MQVIMIKAQEVKQKLRERGREREGDGIGATATQKNHDRSLESLTS